MSSTRIPALSKDPDAYIRVASSIAGTIGEVFGDAITQATTDDAKEALEDCHTELVTTMADRLTSMGPFLNRRRFKFSAEIKKV